MFFDSTFVLLIPALVLAMYAQFKVKSTFEKFSKVNSSKKFTGEQIARSLLSESGLSQVKVQKVKGHLTDHYDPRSRILRLSDSTSKSRSVAAIGVAAHEVGHAIQHQKSYVPFSIRQAIVPVASIGSSLAFPLFFIGFIFSSFHVLMNVGILLFSGAVLFQVVTLPVEFNASSNALSLLKSRSYLTEKEVDQARKVLQAAALTYVASTAMAVMQLLRLLILSGSRD